MKALMLFVKSIRLFITLKIPGGKSRVVPDIPEFLRRLSNDQYRAVEKMRLEIAGIDKGWAEVIFFLVVNIVREKPEKTKEI